MIPPPLKLDKFSLIPSLLMLHAEKQTLKRSGSLYIDWKQGDIDESVDCGFA